MGSIIAIGSSGGVRACALSTTRRLRRQSGNGAESSSACQKNPRRWQKRYVLHSPPLFLFADHQRVRLNKLLRVQIISRKSRARDLTARASAAPSKLSRIKLTDTEKKRLQERIKKATSLQEIIALEKELNEGRLPTGIHGDAMEE